MPGLSGLNAMAKYPFDGSSATSRRGGFLKLKLNGSVASPYVLLDWARMAKS